MSLNTLGSLGRSLRGLLLAAAIGACVLPQPVKADEAALAAQSISDRAVHGDFQGVLALLESHQSAASPQLKSLISEINRYQLHTEAHAQTKREAYDEALAKVSSLAEEGKIEDALIAAIDAHSLAEDKLGLLSDPDVLKVVGQAKARAIAAEKEGDWLEALNLYRELDLLFDDHRTFREPVKRVAKHVRALQLFAPQKLEALYQQRAKARGEDNPASIEPESWKVKLRGIDLPMLRQALAQSAREHVGDGGYLPLVKGSVQSLRILIDTDALADTFPGLKDEGERTIFRDYLDRLTAQLSEPDANLNYLDTWRIIQRLLVTNKETINLPEQVIVYQLAEGATDTLDDFSAVIWPEEKDQFSRHTQGKFYGVGIQISRRDGRLLVVSPLPNTPAQRAGVKAGDIIAMVDGKPTDAWSLDRAVREITGEIGSLVTLSLERTGVADPIEVPIHRDEIVIESILGWQRNSEQDWDYWIDRDAGIGYVRMTQFIPQTAEDLDRAVSELMNEGDLRGLILDLRFNPGGLLTSAVDISDRFIDEGTIVSTVTADGRQNNESRAQKRTTYPRFPVVVLVNQGSASASEIVSGALQDYGRAYIVGQRSFGKGSVQDLFPLDHGKAYLKLTTQYYMLPGGRIIHRKPEADTWGIEPDLQVAMTERQVADALEYRQEVDVIRDPAELAADDEQEEPKAAIDLIEDGIDPQLEAGLLLIKTQLVADDIALARGE